VPELRHYFHEDFDRLVEIDQACFVEGIAYSPDEMRYFLAQPSAFTLVGTEDGKIQGFILMGRIITIDVEPSAQHTGLGTLLLTSAETELRQAGCDYVELEVAVDNETALRFYKKHGYSVLKVLPRYYLASIDGLLMGKEL
jgi:ribosomal protein S18 acetylase RimI-like enzyme